VRLDELLNDTVTAMRVQADAEHVRVIAEVPSDLGWTHANSEKLQRVLFNLLQNAIRHTPADGSVTVRADTTAAGFEIEVSDTGSGIDPAERDRVFEAFYRAGPNGSRTTDGAGLGLAISRAIVEAHGGRIWVADSPPGTKVRFSLPAQATLR
jgi:signal transduction histidine kinase